MGSPFSTAPERASPPEGKGDRVRGHQGEPVKSRTWAQSTVAAPATGSLSTPTGPLQPRTQARLRDPSLLGGSFQDQQPCLLPHVSGSGALPAHSFPTTFGKSRGHLLSLGIGGQEEAGGSEWVRRVEYPPSSSRYNTIQNTQLSLNFK